MTELDLANNRRDTICRKAERLVYKEPGYKYYSNKS